MRRALLIDAGNTRVKWALAEEGADPGQFLFWGAVGHEGLSGLTATWFELPTLTSVIACQVAGSDAVAELNRGLGLFGLAPHWLVPSARQLGVINGYREPTQLGPDRWAALLAARARTKQAAVVVNVGTALTVDALCADGRFLGGVIVPGLPLMLQALAKGTARLHRQPGNYSPFPTSTGDALMSGALDALAGTVERVAHRMVAAGEGEPRCLLSGGDADAVARRLDLAVEQVPSLVLEGLARVAFEDDADATGSRAE